MVILGAMGCKMADLRPTGKVVTGVQFDLGLITMVWKMTGLCPNKRQIRLCVCAFSHHSQTFGFGLITMNRHRGLWVKSSIAIVCNGHITDNCDSWLNPPLSKCADKWLICDLHFSAYGQYEQTALENPSKKELEMKLKNLERNWEQRFDFIMNWRKNLGTY